MWKCNQCGATSQPGGPCKCGGEFKWLSEEEGSNKKTVDEGVDLVICEACGGDGPNLPFGLAAGADDRQCLGPGLRKQPRGHA